MNLSELTKKKPLLFDGSMGTWYTAQPGNSGKRCELANINAPDEILAIHRQYLEAGCHAIKTNTFSVSNDTAQGNDSLARELIEAGCRLAKQAAGPYDAFVFADIGPAPCETDNAGEVYIKQIKLFLKQGIRCFLVETLSSDNGIPEAAQYLKTECPDTFLLVSYAVDPDGITQDGHWGRTLLTQTAHLAHVDAIGVNCVSGPAHLLRFAKSLAECQKPFSVMPNAGYPTILGRQMAFRGTPPYFAEKLVQTAEAGASIVGGCCGTTPAHIAQLAASLHGLDFTAIKGQPRPKETAAVQHHPNDLADKLSAGKKVVAVELDPPVDDDITKFSENVRLLQNAGIDVLTIADCPIGRPRADSSLLACKLKRELGLTVMPHMTCRDRNLNAIKALLLGLSMEQVHNILLITGDPIPNAQRDEIKSVFNFNSRKLIRYVDGLNKEVLSTPFQIFGALDVNAHNFDIQLRMALEKEANGLQGFLTQPVLSREAFENLKLARATLKGKILGGIYPVVSHRNACFLNNEISGMRVCDEIISLYEQKDRKASEEIAVSICTAIAKEIDPYIDGFYLMTPFNRVSLICRILDELSSI